MSNLIEQSNWTEGIYQIEQTDLVLGGENGIANQQAKDLADRTLWLRKGLSTYSGITILNASSQLTSDQFKEKLVLIDAKNATIETTLPEFGSVEVGTRIRITVYNVNKSQVALKATSINPVLIGSTVRNTIYLGDAETVDLVKLTDKWLVLHFDGYLKEVGKPVLDYAQRPNTVIAKGQTLNRADYPRLWEFAQTSNLVISEFNWTNYRNTYRGYYSQGDGSTTFRLPDMRAMFLRALDLGAGIDIGREMDLPGIYQADEFKSHTHSGMFAGNQKLDGPANYQSAQPQAGTTGATGGLETRPKNIGLIPLLIV